MMTIINILGTLHVHKLGVCAGLTKKPLAAGDDSQVDSGLPIFLDTAHITSQEHRKKLQSYGPKYHLEVF